MHYSVTVSDEEQQRLGRVYSERPLLFWTQWLYLQSVFSKHLEGTNSKVSEDPIPANFWNELEEQVLGGAQPDPSYLRGKQSLTGIFNYLHITLPNYLIQFKSLSAAIPCEYTIKKGQGLLRYLSHHWQVLDLSPQVHFDSEAGVARNTILTQFDASHHPMASYVGNNTFKCGSLLDTVLERLDIASKTTPETELLAASEAKRSQDSLVGMYRNLYGPCFSEQPVTVCPGVSYYGWYDGLQGDNSAVNRIISSAGLTRKSRALASHGLNARKAVRETVERNDRYNSKLCTTKNSANILTKLLPGKNHRSESELMGAIAIGKVTVTVSSLQAANEVVGRNLSLIVSKQLRRCELPYGWTKAMPKSIRELPL